MSSMQSTEQPKRFRTPLALMMDRFESYGVVIDSSIVIEDLRWKVLKRRNPSVRSLLDRALDSSLLTPYVPDVLYPQVEENIRELADRHQVPIEQFEAEWQALKPKLQLVPLPPDALEGIDIRDTTDAPFVAAQVQTKASAILSHDKDILESAAPSAGRSALEQTTLLERALVASLGATFTFSLVAFAPLILAGLGLWGIYLLAKRRPGWALAALAVCGVLVWLFWDQVKAAFKKVFSKETKETFFDFLGTFAVAAMEYRKKTEEAQAALEVTLHLPPRQAAEPPSAA